MHGLYISFLLCVVYAAIAESEAMLYDFTIFRNKIHSVCDICVCCHHILWQV